jgi:Kdo2-lipid IVA lauroyltransferase/acyltransferase
MKQSPPWRAKIELALCKLGLLIIPSLPRRAVVALARSIAAVAWLVARRDRRVGLANLDLTYGDTLTPAAKRAILRESFHTFALMMLDIFWFSKKTVARVASWVDFDPSMEPLWHHRATVGVTAHMGNWELLGQSVSLRGYPLASVAMPLANPAVDELFQRVRTDYGQQIIPRQGAVRHLLRSLRTGHKIALLLDQNTLPSEGGQFVEFFGVPVPVSAAGSVLGLKTGAVFFFGFCLPQPDGRYHMVSTGAFTPDPVPAGSDEAAVVAALTQRTAAMIEKAVRAYPGQWLWTYKRWKFIAPGTDPARYPYYAKPIPVAAKA